MFYYQPPGHKRTENLFLLFPVLAPHPSRPRARRRPPLLLVPGIRRGEPGHTQLQQQGVVLPPIVVSNTHACQFPYFPQRKSVLLELLKKSTFPPYPKKKHVVERLRADFFFRIAF